MSLNGNAPIDVGGKSINPIRLCVESHFAILTRQKSRVIFDFPNRMRLGDCLRFFPKETRKVADYISAILSMPVYGVDCHISRIATSGNPRGPVASCELGSVAILLFYFNPYSHEVTMSTNPNPKNPIIAAFDEAVTESMELRNILFAISATNPDCSNLSLSEVLELNAAIALANELTDSLMAQMERATNE